MRKLLAPPRRPRAFAACNEPRMPKSAITIAEIRRQSTTPWPGSSRPRPVRRERRQHRQPDGQAVADHRDVPAAAARDAPAGTPATRSSSDAVNRRLLLIPTAVAASLGVAGTAMAEHVHRRRHLRRDDAVDTRAEDGTVVDPPRQRRGPHRCGHDVQARWSSHLASPDQTRQHVVGHDRRHVVGRPDLVRDRPGVRGQDHAFRLPGSGRHPRDASAHRSCRP